MHEMSLVESLMESLLNLLEEHPEWERVERVHLRVGAMRQVVPEAMEFCYRTAIAGTPLEGSELVLNSVPVHCRCNACGHRWPGDDRIFICPVCSSPEVELEEGMELEIDTLEVEEQHA